MNFDDLTKYIRSLPDNQIPGIDLMVFHQGKEVYRCMNGTCDYLRRKSVSPDTRYYIYSMTKPITMTAVMQCVERGEIWLEDYVANYIPAFSDMKVLEKDGTVRPAKKKIKIKHLLSMTSGLDYRLDSPSRLEAMRDPMLTTEKFINAVAADPLRFEPGTKYKYSLSHDVAARVVEVVTGKTFGEYLQEHIFAPLGMNDTTFRETPAIRRNLAAQFRRDDVKDKIYPIDFRNGFVVSQAYESGGAGLITSTEDYGKFVSAMSTAFHDEHPILGQAAIELMRTPQVSDEILEGEFSKFEQGYSYGLGVRTMKYPEKAGAKSPVGEFGWDGAAGSVSFIDPDNQIAMVYLIQVGRSKFSYFTLFPEVRDKIYDILLNS
ncbi:MAG: beta-lactamase family protein [Clostridia bacterium]|nr:beta-lactamase family protein [Clostridia bacterium]